MCLSHHGYIANHTNKVTEGSIQVLQCPLVINSVVEPSGSGFLPSLKINLGKMCF